MLGVWHSPIRESAVIRVRRQKLLLLFLLRQIVDYDSLLLFLEQKDKCHWDFPRDMKGKTNFLFPSAVLSLAHGEQEWSGLSDLGSGWVLQAGVGAQHCIESCVHLSWEWFPSYHTPGRFVGLFAETSSWAGRSLGCWYRLCPLEITDLCLGAMIFLLCICVLC